MATLSQNEQNMNILREADLKKEPRMDDKMPRTFNEKENLDTKPVRVDNVFKGRENLKNILRSKCENVVPVVQSQIAIYQDDDDDEEAGAFGKKDADVSIRSEMSIELNESANAATSSTNCRNPLQELPLRKYILINFFL
uniref:Uncharacterized protein n=1 Tax=Phlebotomus papatasi TaxID=29031 RepID=A0A1B0D0A5_PHLPP